MTHGDLGLVPGHQNIPAFIRAALVMNPARSFEHRSDMISTRHMTES